MRIIDESGKWDLLYEQVTLKLDKNRLYAYPLFTNIVSKPIFIQAFVNEEEGMRKMMEIRYAYRCGADAIYLSPLVAERERDFIKQKQDAKMCAHDG